MPTAPKLVSALLLAGLAWIVSGLALPLLSNDGTLPGFAAINVALGVIIGWSWLGPRLPAPFLSTLGHGITTAVALAVTSLFAQGFVRMLRQAWSKAYPGPIEAVADIAAIMARFGAPLAEPVLVGSLVAGSVTAALLANLTGRSRA